MKVTRMLVSSVGVIACFVGVAHADDAAGDPAAYKQKLHDCATQMKTDHPDMNHAARRKECRKQLGASPKANAAAPATSPTPPATSP